MIHSLSAEINYISFWWIESNIDISGTLEITVPWNETVSYQCVLAGLSLNAFIQFDVYRLVTLKIDPGEGAQIVILSVFFWYHECNITDPSSPDIQIISPPANEVNRIIIRYKGDTSLTIDGIHWIDNVEHRIDEFCVPQNHFYWASESGITECYDFDDDFTVFNPSMTIYIDYEWDRYETFLDFGDYYNGFISPAFISNISITARTYKGCNVDKTTLKLYWGRNIYECTIWLNSTTMTHSCNDTKLELVQSNCTQRAFAVGVTTEDDSGFAVDAISLVDEDGNIQTMDTAACFDRAVIVDFSTVWKGNVIDIYALDTNADSMCFESTSYSVFSSLCFDLSCSQSRGLLFADDISSVDCPTEQRSHNPNISSIIYSDFNSSVTAFYRITNWTDSEISDVNEDVERFITSLTTFIHQGFDNDPVLEYQDIKLNITFINDYTYADLIGGSESERKDILDLSLSNGMELQYLIECSHDSICEYIAADSDGTSVGMDSSVFEESVTSKLQAYFMSTNSYCTSTNATHDDLDSALAFVVDNIATSAIQSDQLPIFGILLVGGGLCLFISGVSVGIILYHRKRQQLDSSKIAAELARSPMQNFKEQSVDHNGSVPAPGMNEDARNDNQVVDRAFTETLTISQCEEGQGAEGVMETRMDSQMTISEISGQVISTPSGNMDGTVPGAYSN